MSILTNWGRKLKMIAVPLALGALAACATPFNANVQRFQSALPAPQGQTFTVVADDPALAGGLEFSQYAHQVADQMAHLGYTPVNSVDAADLVVRFDYGIDKGRQRVRQTGFADPFWAPWYGGRYSRFGYSRLGWGPGNRPGSFPRPVPRKRSNQYALRWTITPSVRNRIPMSRPTFHPSRYSRSALSRALRSDRRSVAPR